MSARELVFLLSVMCLLHVTFGQDYDYSSSSGKGPNKWATLFRNYCSKSSQSPVDIVTKNVKFDSALLEPELTYNDYATVPSGPTMQIGTNGQYSYRVIVKPNTFSISGGGLNGTYQLHSFHLHWGSNDTQGSEHTVDGKKYPAELHLVHFNNKYSNLSNALNYADGLAAIGILLEVGKENAALQSFLKYAPNVLKYAPEPKELYNLTQTHALKGLLPWEPRDYYRYKGSLTTPYCYEVVTWTVLKDVAKISNEQLQLLRGLKDYSKAMVNNYRPVQPLNGRVIKAPPPENGAHHVTNTMTIILAVVIAVFKFF